jgi:hypothetical protein
VERPGEDDEYAYAGVRKTTGDRARRSDTEEANIFELVRKFAKSKFGRANYTCRGARPRQDADLVVNPNMLVRIQQELELEDQDA